MGIKIIDVKVVGICSKCRKEGDEILRDIHGRAYEDKELACISCALGKPSPLIENSKKREEGQ